MSQVFPMTQNKRDLSLITLKGYKSPWTADMTDKSYKMHLLKVQSEIQYYIST